jgi:hypothetical protein
MMQSIAENLLSALLSVSDLSSTDIQITIEEARVENVVVVNARQSSEAT